MTLTRLEGAEYIADLAAGLSKIAHNSDNEMLAYLLDMIVEQANQVATGQQTQQRPDVREAAVL
jgi:hypothetical protein